MKQETKDSQTIHFAAISVWCETFAANFGEVVINATLSGLTTTANGPARTCVKPAEVSLGSFVTRAHRVTGEVVILSERVLQIRGFVFDGEAPAVYFWADKSATPSNNGVILLDGAPSNGCGTEALKAADGTKTYQVEFREGQTIKDYLGGSISVWCDEFSVNFGEVRGIYFGDILLVISKLSRSYNSLFLFVQVVIPSVLTSVASTEDGPPLQCSADGRIPDVSRTPVGFNCEPLNDQYQVRWAVMGNEIAIELVGEIDETQWMGFGVSGSTTKTFMLGADPTVVDMFNGTFRARDFYLNDRSQCSGVIGVCPDSRNGTDDVKNGSVSGVRENGITLVRYIRPLRPSDTHDSAIRVTKGVETFIVWAIGPVSVDTGLPQFHTIWPQGVDFKVEFGRNVTNNCEPLLGTSETPTPTVEAFDIPILKDTTEIVARIGPSGGAQVRIMFSC